MQRVPDLLDLLEARITQADPPPPSLPTRLCSTLLGLAWEVLGEGAEGSFPAAAGGQGSALRAQASGEGAGASAVDVLGALQRLEELFPGILCPHTPTLALLALGAEGQVWCGV